MMQQILLADNVSHNIIRVNKAILLAFQYWLLISYDALQKSGGYTKLKTAINMFLDDRLIEVFHML